MNLIRSALGIDADLRNFDRLYEDHGKLVLALEQRLMHMESTIGERLSAIEDQESRIAECERRVHDVLTCLGAFQTADDRGTPTPSKKDISRIAAWLSKEQQKHSPLFDYLMQRKREEQETNG